MAELLVILAVSLVWVFLAGSGTLVNLLVGALIGLLLLSIVTREQERSFPRRLVAAVRFGARFFAELLVAGVVVAGLTVTPRPRFHPHVIAVPLRVRSDAAISLLSAAITLLPGTVAMGTSEDRRVLYAHAIGTADPAKARDSVVRIEELILGFLT